MRVRAIKTWPNARPAIWTRYEPPVRISTKRDAAGRVSDYRCETAGSRKTYFVRSVRAGGGEP